MAQSTTVFDARDRHAFTIFKEQRIELPLEKMSPNFIKAVISVEDQRFYQHSGVDAIRTVGAVVRNLEAGRRAEGGSTITQQLARLSFLTRGKTYRRKLKEIVLASYIESEYSKNEILQMYLNKVVFRRRALRRRSRRARVFRKERFGSDRGRGGAARRTDPVAIGVRADGQPGSGRSPAGRSCCRRWSIPARSTHRRPSARRRCRSSWSTASTSTRAPASISRRPCAASWSIGSAGRACRREACASSPRSTSICSAAPRRWSRRISRTSKAGGASRTRRARSFPE